MEFAFQPSLLFFFFFSPHCIRFGNSFCAELQQLETALKHEGFLWESMLMLLYLLQPL